ncbi:MAG: thioredoxin domain-containing protein, partial [Chloroflexi bacterium]|nr:thioredoxin domain-containing protein [Chloroflexota bacterium]
PIFLSIGYAACHWCHVMAHESFENEQIARLMNEHFVCIKVDREERPDLDSIYMSAVVALTGHGGWPMSVWLTPEGVPFYGGTYYPPTPRHGLPSFPQVLQSIAEAWKARRAQVDADGQRVLDYLQEAAGAGTGSGGGELAPGVLGGAVRGIWQGFDWRNHGWGQAPRFPQPMTIEFLLRYHLLAGDPLALERAVKSLRAMARGGMYDQVGGGFHRYSVDASWLVPHFEKMLYDNSQLARAYLHAWGATGDPEFRRVCEEILDYVAREMTDPQGGFYATQDADSEGEEGKFFLWTPAELRPALGTQDAEFAIQAYGVTERGNFEGKNILHRPAGVDALARQTGLPVEEFNARLSTLRSTLYAARSTRTHPGLDDKVLAGWNGLMLAAFAEAARAFGRDDYRGIAVRNAGFVLGQMRTPAGRLHRSWRHGKARLNAYLEDYSYLIEGLLCLYETSFDPRWYRGAVELAEAMLAHFAAPDGGFYDTSDDHEALVTRPRDLQDNATPSGNAMAATALLRLAALSGEGRYARAAEDALRLAVSALPRHPTAFAQWLVALTFYLGSPVEIAIVGEPGAEDTRALLAEAARGFRPFQVLAVAPDGSSPVPLLAGRSRVAGKATAYVCQNFACRLPVTDPAALAGQFGHRHRGG